MTNTYRVPFLKVKLKFFQDHFNRRERYKAKQFIRNGDYDTPTQRIVPTGSYDVIDQVYNPYKLGGTLSKASRANPKKYFQNRA